jgi:hypothetical protein
MPNIPKITSTIITIIKVRLDLIVIPLSRANDLSPFHVNLIIRDDPNLILVYTKKPNYLLYPKLKHDFHAWAESDLPADVVSEKSLEFCWI